MKNRLLPVLLLALCLSLAACGAGAEPTQAPTEPTAAPTEPEPTAAPTEPVRQLAEPVFPDQDEATGTLMFYFGDKAVYAGCPVSDLIGLGVHTFTDLDEILEPMHTTDAIRLRIEDPEVKEKNRPYLFFVAINGSDTPKKISECLVYSITINTDKGIRFGSGQEAAPFVTGETTRDELLAAYGEPDYDYSRTTTYREIAYYEPFSCAYFSFQGKRVRQVTTYYSANLFADVIEGMDEPVLETYFGLDASILMDQYLDVAPYLEEKEPEPTEVPEPTEPPKKTDKTDKKDEDQEIVITSPAGIPPLKKLEMDITLDGKTFELGTPVAQLPDPFGSALRDLQIPLHRNYYYRVGRINDEEFYLINGEGQKNQMSNDLLVKGVITQNRNYVNWGEDYSAFHSFAYMGVTEASTIEDILETFGAPQDIQCSSNARVCYVWMHYIDEAGNLLRFRVDPVTDQIAEFRVSRYYEDERTYI